MVKRRKAKAGLNTQIIPSIKLRCVGVHKVQDSQTCDRYYFWRWVYNIVSKKVNMNFWGGTVTHAGFAMCQRTKNIGKIYQAMDKASKEDLAKYHVDALTMTEVGLQLEMYKIIVKVFVKTQRRLIKQLHTVATEVKFQKNLEMSPVILLGRMDGHGINKKKRPTLIECKTSSRLSSDYFKRLKFDKQINTYAVGLKTIIKKYPAQCRYIVFRKPGIRVKQTETTTQYLIRLEQDLNERNDWYYIDYKHNFGKQSILNTMNDIEQATFDLWSKYNYLSTEKLLCPDSWPRNDRACFNYGTCPYFVLCNNRANYRLYLRLFQMREIRYDLEETELSRKHVVSTIVTSKMKGKAR